MTISCDDTGIIGVRRFKVLTGSYWPLTSTGTAKFNFTKTVRWS